MNASSKVKKIAFHAGFDLAGISKAEAPEPRHLNRWLECGYHASMSWMLESRDLRLNPAMLIPSAESVISLALNYYHPGEVSIGEEIKISRALWGRDYHKVVGSRFRKFRKLLASEFPGISIFGGVDYVPIMEKLWAEKAGIGWIGKSGLLVTEKFGSWVFLCTLITDLKLDADSPHPGMCGDCTGCMDACPTGAIVSPGIIDANKCLAFNTIENKKNKISSNIEKRMDGWFFGCDACQDSCPWSIENAEKTDISDFSPRQSWFQKSVSGLLNMDETQFEHFSRGSAIRRPGLSGMQRNLRSCMRFKP